VLSDVRIVLRDGDTIRGVRLVFHSVVEVVALGAFQFNFFSFACHIDPFFKNLPKHTGFSEKMQEQKGRV